MHGHAMHGCFSQGCQTDLLQVPPRLAALLHCPSPQLCMHAMLPKHLTCASRFFGVTLTAQAIRARAKNRHSCEGHLFMSELPVRLCRNHLNSTLLVRECEVADLSFVAG